MEGRYLQSVEAASLLRTPLPVEAARSPIREGPGCLARAGVASHVTCPLRGAFHEEDAMTTIMILTTGLVAMSCARRTLNMRQHSARVTQHRVRR